MSKQNEAVPGLFQRTGAYLRGHYSLTSGLHSPEYLQCATVARAPKARFVFTEREPSGTMTLRRGFAVEPGERAVVVEDVITTGGSSREVIEILERQSVDIAGAGSIIDRSGGRVDIGVKRVALATLNVVVYAPDVCPMCRQGLPLVKPGSRKSSPNA